MEELETPPESIVPDPDSPEPSHEGVAQALPNAETAPLHLEADMSLPGDPAEVAASTAEEAAPATEDPPVDDPQPSHDREEVVAAVEDPSPDEPDAAAPAAEDASLQSEAEVPVPSPDPEGEVPSGGEEDPLQPTPSVSMEELLGANEPEPQPVPASVEDTQLRAVVEAIIYVAEEPLTLAQLAVALQQPASRIKDILEELVAEFDKPEHGVTIREVAGGFKMATKAEHHDAVRSFVKSLKPPLKLSLPALETLAVIAYKQPVTSPEIMEIRGVRGAGVLNTLLDRKLIAAAGRKNVIGKPILYKTTKEFLIQFGLKDLSELPSLKEFEEIRRMAFADSEVEATPSDAPPVPTAAEIQPASEPQPESESVPENQEN